MADIKIAYDEISAVSILLNQMCTDTVPILSTLQSKVAHLLSRGGGLYLLQSSPVLDDKYRAFNNGVTQAVQQIPSWAEQFNNIMNQIKDLDRQIVENANAAS